MRCRACNAELTDKEAVRKDGNGEFYDLCDICLEASYDNEEEDDFNESISYD